MCRHKGMHSLLPLFLICQRTNHQQQLQFSEKKKKGIKNQVSPKKFKAQSTHRHNSTFYTESGTGVKQRNGLVGVKYMMIVPLV